VADRTINSLKAARKSLVDVVAPAVDPDDPLAVEQLRLVADYLDFVGARVDYVHDREWFELLHHLSMARSVQEPAAECSGSAVGFLSTAIQEAERLEHGNPHVPEMRDVTAKLAAGIRMLVREAGKLHENARQTLERRILEASRDRIMVDRSWYLPLGFDPRPDEVSPLESVLWTQRESEGRA
jgi:hypothetical protein